jgi:hypothetical protein
MGTPSLHLYLDDSGTRYPDHPSTERKDGLDHFALGGLLIDSEKVTEAEQAHRDLFKKYDLDLDLPLHSSSIRSRKYDFRWMEDDPVRAEGFLEDLYEALCVLPAYVIACVIHRPGYNARYKKTYGSQRWLLCETAYKIVVERAAKFASRTKRKLLIYVEETGKKEDHAIRSYHERLRSAGTGFHAQRSSKYKPLATQDLADVLIKRPSFVTRLNPIAQFSDIALFPVVKGRYDPQYRPFVRLRNAKRRIDDVLDGSEIEAMGIKYSCFDGL